MMGMPQKALTGRMYARRYFRRQLVAAVFLAVAASVMGVLLASPARAAVQEAGTPVAWGYNGQGQTNVPSGLTGAVAVSAGGWHNLAIEAPHADTTAPAAPTLELASASDSGSSSTDERTYDDTPTFEGYAEAGATVKVYDGATLVGSVQADGGTDPTNAANRAWSYTVGGAGSERGIATLGEGTHTISANATDAASNTSGFSNALTVLVDKSAPSVGCSATPNKLRTSANNHKLVTIAASVDVTDTPGGSGADGYELVSVRSSQADSALGKDDVANDIQGWATGTTDTSGQLRAERYGSERLYTLTYQGKDLAGNTRNCQATVRVTKG